MAQINQDDCKPDYAMKSYNKIVRAIVQANSFDADIVDIIYKNMPKLLDEEPIDIKDNYLQRETVGGLLRYFKNRMHCFNKASQGMNEISESANKLLISEFDVKTKDVNIGTLIELLNLPGLIKGYDY